MLFISRIRDYGSYAKYGVADTDDNSEEFVMPSEIETAIFQGVDIKGVSFDGHLCIVPYQDPSSMTVLQTKLATLYEVFVTVYRDNITGICWNTVKSLTPAVIKLSDFGSVCADRLFSNSNIWGAHRATIVLDDSIKFSKPAFYLPGRKTREVDSIGLRIDVRHMNNEKNLARLYHAVATSQPSFVEFVIIDKPSRKRYMLRDYYKIVGKG